MSNAKQVKQASPAQAKQAATQAATQATQATQAATPEVAVSNIGSATQRAIIGAKQHIRALLSADGAALSLAELCKASGKSEVNVRTMLSDLRSAKYAGKAGVFATISTRGTDGVTRYSKAPATN